MYVYMIEEDVCMVEVWCIHSCDLKIMVFVYVDILLICGDFRLLVV